MSLSNEQIERQYKIDQFLRGELSGKDKQDFEARIASDPKLREEVKINKAMMFVIEGKKHKALKEEIMKTNQVVAKMRKRVKLDYSEAGQIAEDTGGAKDLGEKGLSWTNKLIESIDKWVGMLIPSPPAFKLATVAAVLLILMLPAYFLFFAPADPDRLFADNFRPYPDVISSQTRHTEGADELSSVMVDYEKKDYEKFIGKSANFLNKYPDAHEVMFYRGIAYLELNNLGAAISDFQETAKLNNKIADASEWYLALCFVKAQQKNKAHEMLTNIIDKNNQFSKQARKLRRKLR